MFFHLLYILHNEEIKNGAFLIMLTDQTNCKSCVSDLRNLQESITQVGMDEVYHLDQNFSTTDFSKNDMQTAQTLCQRLP